MRGSDGSGPTTGIDGSAVHAAASAAARATVTAPSAARTLVARRNVRAANNTCADIIPSFVDHDSERTLQAMQRAASFQSNSERYGRPVQTFRSLSRSAILNQLHKGRKPCLVGKVHLNDWRNRAQASKATAVARVAVLVSGPVSIGLIGAGSMHMRGAIVMDMRGSNGMVVAAQAMRRVIAQRKGDRWDKQAKAVQRDKRACRPNPRASAESRQHNISLSPS